VIGEVEVVTFDPQTTETYRDSFLLGKESLLIEFFNNLINGY
jgi:hypothetical protein